MPVVYSRKRLRALQQQSSPPPCKQDVERFVTPLSSFQPTSTAASLSSVQSTEKITPTESVRKSDIISSTSTSKRSPKRSSKRRRTLIQTHIDVGQHDISARRCPECQMVYAPGASNDNTLHARHHTRYIRQSNYRPSFSGWMDERIIGSINSGRLIAVTACDVITWRRRAVDIDKFVANHLSTSDKLNLKINDIGWLAVMFVIEGFVQAFLLVDVVRKARVGRVGRDGIVSIADNENVKIKNGAMCGVRKIWVGNEWRRKGVASKMIDAARLNLVYGVVINKGCVAYTATTVAGGRFAKAYSTQRFSNDRILIYTLDDRLSSFQSSEQSDILAVGGINEEVDNNDGDDDDLS